MMCSNTVTCNESERVVMSSVEGPEIVRLLPPCKSHLRSRTTINNVVHTVIGPLSKVRHYLFWVEVS